MEKLKNGSKMASGSEIVGQVRLKPFLNIAVLVIDLDLPILLVQWRPLQNVKNPLYSS